MKEALSATYWNTRYKQGKTGWDLKAISPPIKAYIDQLTDKSLKILIPGAGYGFEAQYLWEQGFKNTYVIDLSELALQNLQKRVPNFPKEQRLLGNFFELDGRFDLILEQTFFCALDPQLRPDYTQKMHSLLSSQGKLVGVLFDFPLTDEGPPFGGHIAAYEKYFAPYFQIQIMARCYNSAGARDGKELFIKLTPKNP